MKAKNPKFNNDLLIDIVDSLGMASSQVNENHGGIGMISFPSPTTRVVVYT